MARRKRRNHSAAFKAKVALAAVRGDRTLAELAEQLDVHANQIQDWKKKLLAGAEGIFSQGTAEANHNEQETQKLHAKTGRLTMENDFLFKRSRIRSLMGAAVCLGMREVVAGIGIISPIHGTAASYRFYSALQTLAGS